MRISKCWLIVLVCICGVSALWSQDSQSDIVLINMARMYGVLLDDEALMKQIGSMVLFRIYNNEPFSTLPRWVQDLKDTKPEWVDSLKFEGWPEGASYSQNDKVIMNMARMYGIRSDNPTLLLTTGKMILFRTQYEIPLSTLPVWVVELME